MVITFQVMRGHWDRHTEAWNSDGYSGNVAARAHLGYGRRICLDHGAERRRCRELAHQSSARKLEDAGC